MTERALIRALETLGPIRSRLVVVGGAAHRLFPLHALGRESGFELLTTDDIDLAVPLELAHDAPPGLRDRLEAAGFGEEVAGAAYPSHKYRLAAGNRPYLQFLAPLTGSGVGRDGQRDLYLRFSGITAEKLRYVHVLLHEPWTVCLRQHDLEYEARIANPVAFLAQKILIMPTRPLDKRGKDLLYIYDTLAIFAGHLEELGARADELVPSLSPRQASRLGRNAQAHCLREGAESQVAARVAAESLRPRPPDSALIAAACRRGLPWILAALDLRL